MTEPPLLEHLIAKGSTVHSTLIFLESRLDSASVAKILGALDSNTRAALVTVGPTDELPYAYLVELWRSADAHLSAADAKWAEASGAFSIDSLGVQLYGGILRKPTPREFLTQSVSLFRLYYHPGDMEVVEDVPGRVVLRLDGFDPITRIFCDRQTGGLGRAIALAGGVDTRVRHVRCCIDGDAFCEWELQWKD